MTNCKAREQIKAIRDVMDEFHIKDKLTDSFMDQLKLRGKTLLQIQLILREEDNAQG